MAASESGCPETESTTRPDKIAGAAGGGVCASNKEKYAAAMICRLPVNSASLRVDANADVVLCFIYSLLL
jgi:hypothetical protein